MACATPSFSPVCAKMRTSGKIGNYLTSILLKLYGSSWKTFRHVHKAKKVMHTMGQNIECPEMPYFCNVLNNCRTNYFFVNCL